MIGVGKVARLSLAWGSAMAIAASAAGGAATTPMPSWPVFRDRFIATDLAQDTNAAIQAGRHDMDGRLPDWSEAGLMHRADFLRRTITDAKAYPDARLTADERFERDYLVAVARGTLFWLTDADDPHHNPAYYIGNGLDPAVYTSRPYAAPEVRMRGMIAYLRGVPAAAAQIRANLRTPLPAVFVTYGVTAIGGLADYYGTDGKAAFAAVKDARLQAEYDRAAAPAAAAMRDLAGWMKAHAATGEGGFALGAAKLSRMLAATEMVDVPLDRLEAAGRADLARNQAALAKECARFVPGATIEACLAKVQGDKPAEGPVAAARAQVPMLRAFVQSHDIASIPGTEQALVAQAPPYNAQNAAYMDPPGPFEKGVASVYYIAPPDPHWSQAQQLAYIPSKSTLLFTTVHEVMPGHFLQFLHSNRAASPIGRLFVGYAYAEGWAHYTEQMMWDAGLGDGDPELHIGQLTDALLRDVRFLSTIGMHARGMTLEQSRQMFLRDAHQDEGNAGQQARRGAYDPGYINYTLGKLMLMKLRDDWTATRGGRAAWRGFHDAVLSHGGPPIPLLRRAMLPGGGPAL